MKKQNKKRTDPIRIELNGGDLVVELDHRGAVYMVEVGEGEYNEKNREYGDRRFLELSASELDAIAVRSKEIQMIPAKLEQLQEQFDKVLDGFGPQSGIRSETRTCQHNVVFRINEDGNSYASVSVEDDDFSGSVEIGCQTVDAEDIERVHNASLKQRKANRK